MVILRRGSQGNSVETLQNALNAHGFGPLDVDGVFGTKTFNALIQFQQTQGIPYDGIVGPVTWKLLLTGPASNIPEPKEQNAELISFIEGLSNDKIKKALRFALSDVGKKEDPDGSNTGPLIEHLVDGYSKFWKIAGEPYLPWCMMAASVWTAGGLGLGKQGNKIDWKQHPFRTWVGSVSMAYQWAERNQRLDKSPVPGHIYTMPREGSSSDPQLSTSQGHSGLIVKVTASELICIDGNVSNSVGIRIRKKSDAKGLIRWWE